MVYLLSISDGWHGNMNLGVYSIEIPILDLLQYAVNNYCDTYGGNRNWPFLSYEEDVNGNIWLHHGGVSISMYKENVQESVHIHAK